MQILLALLPILTFLLAWASFYKRLDDWRSSLLAACVLWATFVVVITELLSAFRALTFSAALIAWILALLAALLWARGLIGDPRSLWKAWHWPELSGFELFLLGGCAFIAIATAFIALIAPPNVYDSLTYHMPRIMHWIQNRSVAYYPTHILRQLYLVPGAEYIILHFQLLTGSDRLANFAQWFSMIGSAVGVSLISGLLGAGRRGQLFSAIASMTIPMGILQASGTQNDYVTAFWLVCFIYWMLLLKAKWHLGSMLAAGASLGLAAFTKSTTYIFALPFLVWFSVWLFQKYKWRSMALWAPIALAFLLINLASYVRSEPIFGNPLGITRDGPARNPSAIHSYSNDIFSLPELASNVVRNMALHIGVPIPGIIQFLDRRVLAFHELIGISLNDRRTTFPGTTFQVPRIQFSGDHDGNILHFFLIIASVFFILSPSYLRQGWALYAVCILSGFLIFCLYLKWQPYNSRLQLPLFVLYAPLLGGAGAALRPRWIAASICVLLVLGALPWVFLNDLRPLVGRGNIFRSDRNSLYFRAQASEQASYVGAVDFVAGSSNGACREVGVYMDVNDPEYLLWVLLQQKVGGNILLESVDVQNISIRASGNFPQFTPCAIFVVNPPPPGGFEMGGRLYRPAWTSEVLSVFLAR